MARDGPGLSCSRRCLGELDGVPEQQEASAWSGASGSRAAITFKLDLAGTAVVQEYRQVRRPTARSSSGHGGSSSLRAGHRAGGSKGRWLLKTNSPYGYPSPPTGGWDGPSAGP